MHFKYIQAATRTGQIREVERIVRESNFYNPEKVKNFLKEAKLADQLPLIIVCDRFDFVHDLVLYLYQNGLTNFIEVYVQRVNSARTPQVVGGLLDVDCDEATIKALLASVTGPVPVDELVDEVEKRNRLKLILPWIEAKVQAGQQDPALFNALAKIKIDSNVDPESFLKDNNAYDPLVVGKYCEKRDPYLAYIAYAKGLCDDELIAITTENAMYKHLARYLVKRRRLELWQQVLGADNVHKRPLVDQVVATAVPESTDPEDVSVTVKAFLSADLPSELIELLEKIVLEQSAFSDNANLKKLLMLTAIRADKGRVMGYIDRVEGFDVQEIAGIMIEHGLHEEAFTLFRKNNMHLEAMNTLVEYVVSIDRAQQYADKVDQPAVWSRLGKAQLDGLRVKDAIDSYVRAEDPSNYLEVIETASRAGKHDDLVRYLQMARKTLREPAIDTELAVAYAKTDRLRDMEDFLSMTNVADLLSAGEKAFDAELYDAAKLLFTSISNWARLATTLIYLGENQAAVDAARKAGNTQVWRQVNAACIDKKEFRLAQICGLNLVVHAEELSALVRLYEYQGYTDELMSLLEAGLGLERAHMGMFTELSVLYAKVRLALLVFLPPKAVADLTFPFLPLLAVQARASHGAPQALLVAHQCVSARLTSLCGPATDLAAISPLPADIPKVLRAAEQAHLWSELVFLYVHYDEFDNAALAMMERSAAAWEHNQFKEVIVKVANIEIYYKVRLPPLSSIHRSMRCRRHSRAALTLDRSRQALNFYLEQQPMLLNDLLTVLAPRIDHTRVVKMFQKADELPRA